MDVEITAIVALVQQARGHGGLRGRGRAGEASLREGVFFEGHVSQGLFAAVISPKPWELSPEQATPSFTSGQPSTGWSQDDPGSTP
ncbi:hypothetical protein [Streptomyces viridochromogenes]|uniref:Uncharacterized protein n=1 Tax=Streptomyces viridochromogenes Tue57 TaxID=1160705 RepID=L8P4Y5_STRVR|nr:hypothetical protein [Streptomyces viridochromogenes]ELS51545.1 hypothetical protein STVIR_7563 [Streptomyces viridochromogenes Tue57]